MTLRQPPSIAGRLLKRLVPAQDHDVLLGDLCEEYQRGRSIVWYWLQIFVAIAVGTWRDVRTNTLVAARAVITGLIAQFFLLAAFPVLVNVLTGAGFMWDGRWIGLPWYWHSPDAFSLVMVMQAISIAGHVMIGWLIVRLYRGHGLAIVVIYCCALGVLRTYGLLQLAKATGWPPHFNTVLYRAAIGQIGQCLLAIAGGYLATRPEKIA
jgi:hypothetical protein